MSTAMKHILRLADEYRRAASVPETTVSYRVFRDCKKIRMIREGGDLTTERYEYAVRWFSENWPDSAEWPVDTQRPTPASAQADQPAHRPELA